MELALYEPTSGYYARPTTQPGRGGDYFTSVSVGRLFGDLLAYRFAAWLQPLREEACGRRLAIVEAGGHDGRLAADILQWFAAHHPTLLADLDYVFLEPLAPLEDRQRATVGAFTNHVRWARTWSDLDPVRGVIFSNELLDAFPVHRLGWDARRRDWFEWGVAWEREGFRWARLGPWGGTRELLPPTGSDDVGLAACLPDGFTIEVCPAAPAWWSAAARSLERGKLMAVDYGLEIEERVAPQRARGTLRAYQGHRLMEDPLLSPGSMDLTAHVDFTALQRAGEACGLRTACMESQSRFLTRIVEQANRTPVQWLAWNERRIRQFATLTHPAHMGHAFRVLVQETVR